MTPKLSAWQFASAFVTYLVGICKLTAISISASVTRNKIKKIFHNFNFLPIQYATNCYPTRSPKTISIVFIATLITRPTKILDGGLSNRHFETTTFINNFPLGQIEHGSNIN